LHVFIKEKLTLILILRLIVC